MGRLPRAAQHIVPLARCYGNDVLEGAAGVLGYLTRPLLLCVMAGKRQKHSVFSCSIFSGLWNKRSLKASKDVSKQESFVGVVYIFLFLVYL